MGVDLDLDLELEAEAGVELQMGHGGEVVLHGRIDGVWDLTRRCQHLCQLLLLLPMQEAISPLT